MNRAIRILALCGFATLIGCDSGPSNPTTYPVTGTVMYKGSPVEGATVVLVPDDPGGKGAAGNSDASGKFSLMTFVKDDGALPGTYKVRVSAYPSVSYPTGDGSEDLSPEEEEEAYGGVEEAPEARNKLPAKYEDANTSGLTHTVPESATELNLDLN